MQLAAMRSYARKRGWKIVAEIKEVVSSARKPFISSPSRTWIPPSQIQLILTLISLS